MLKRAVLITSCAYDEYCIAGVPRRGVGCGPRGSLQGVRGDAKLGWDERGEDRIGEYRKREDERWEGVGWDRKSEERKREDTIV